ncbi:MULTISPECIES: hypothetical protein [unclassified Endozoicomonas]
MISIMFFDGHLPVKQSFMNAVAKIIPLNRLISQYEKVWIYQAFYN